MEIFVDVLSGELKLFTIHKGIISLGSILSINASIINYTSSL